METVIDKDTPLYNSRTILGYGKLVERRYPQVDFNAVLAHAGMTPYEVADAGHWFTQEQVDRFYARLSEVCDNPRIAREAGLLIAGLEEMGPVRQNMLTFLGPANLFAVLGKITPNFTRSSTYATRRLGRNTVEVVVSFKEGVEEKGYQCENRLATLESVFSLFHHQTQQVTHPECVFKGGKACRYIFSWQDKPSARIKRCRNVLTVALLAALLYIGLSQPATDLVVPLLGGALAVVLIAYWAEYLEKKEISRHIESFRNPTDQLIDQIKFNYDSARIVNEIGQAINAETSVEEILSRVVSIMEKRLAFDRGMILLADDTKSNLVYRAGFGLLPAQIELFSRTPIPLDRGRPGSFLARAFLEKQPIIVEDLDRVRDQLSEQALLLADGLHVRSYLSCPIIAGEEVIGVLAAGYARLDQPLTQSDVNLLTGITPVLGIRINNVRLLADQIRQNDEISSLQAARDAIAAAKEKSDRLAEDLRLANEELKNFTYIVSHDLRAPLVNIKGFGAELTSAIADLRVPLEKCRQTLSASDLGLLDQIIDKDVPEALDFINSSVSRMDGQINAILMLSRLGRRELAPERVEVGPLVETIVKTLTHQLETHRATARVEALPVLTADRVSLEQIFGNLLDNAVKYLDQDRPGTIEVSSTETGEEYIFSIRDNGRGIAAADMDKVFTLFRRAGKQDTRGEGMGLTYVKTLVRRLDGRIWCESTLGVGTTFFVALPKN